MRKLTPFETNNLSIFTKYSIELALIEPTHTGLIKSTMDATSQVRSYLKENNIHDFKNQPQGQNNKILLGAKLITATSSIISTCSLYRPDSKKGDPRIWFKNLRQIAAPNDILGIIGFDSKIYVVNITTLNINNLVDAVKNNPLKELINEINDVTQKISNELLALLQEIADRGPIPALLNADTAIGRTLETLLGISINSSKLPDYKGIELKANRDKKGNRKTLFAQVPDWNVSNFKSTTEILNNFGYTSTIDFRLYCTISTLSRNNQSLILRLDNEQEFLFENSNKNSIGDFVAWRIGTLHKRLIEKHNETFWITADSIFIEGIEHFQYKKIEHTKKPIVSQFNILLEQGIITLDHLIKRDLKGRVFEKGPLFKIKPNSLNLLFPPSQSYNLIKK